MPLAFAAASGLACKEKSTHEEHDFHHPIHGKPPQHGNTGVRASQFPQHSPANLFIIFHSFFLSYQKELLFSAEDKSRVAVALFVLLGP
jgi:hypothetical protein